jgi:hypothetical protein
VRRTIRPAREHGALVKTDSRSERTANLLIARLDALARVAGRLPNAEAERLVELAAVATMRAVALELLEAERADSIWRDAHECIPQLRAVQLELPDRLAA